MEDFIRGLDNNEDISEAFLDSLAVLPTDGWDDTPLNPVQTTN